MNYQEIYGGKDGINYYDNDGENQWGLVVDDFMYDEYYLTSDKVRGQEEDIGFIDTMEFGIKLPFSIWDELQNIIIDDLKNKYINAKL